jgi:hypothetical protein
MRILLDDAFRGVDTAIYHRHALRLDPSRGIAMVPLSLYAASCSVSVYRDDCIRWSKRSEHWLTSHQAAGGSADCC